MDSTTQAAINDYRRRHPGRRICEHCRKTPACWYAFDLHLCQRCLTIKATGGDRNVCQCCKIDDATLFKWQLHLCDDCYAIKLEEHGAAETEQHKTGCRACEKRDRKNV